MALALGAVARGVLAAARPATRRRGDTRARSRRGSRRSRSRAATASRRSRSRGRSGSIRCPRMMILVVTGIGFLIHVYSIGYMAGRGAGRVRALLLVPEPVLLLHAHAGARRELPRDVRRLGGRGALLLPADRLLVHEEERVGRRQEGVHRQPDRRLGLPAGRVPGVLHLRHASTSARWRTRRGRCRSRPPGSACCR